MKDTIIYYQVITKAKNQMVYVTVIYNNKLISTKELKEKGFEKHLKKDGGYVYKYTKEPFYELKTVLDKLFNTDFDIVKQN